MNKTMIVILGLVCVLVLGLFFIYAKTGFHKTPISITPSPTPQSTQTSVFCTHEELKADLSLSPGAGNVFGTFTLTNISNRTCKIQGGNFIAPQYMPTSLNIEVNHVGQTQPDPFTLVPNQNLYSQLHYPNGPQCSSAIVNTNVSFTYPIAPADSVTFSSNGSTNQVIPTCQKPSEITTLQIWNMATQPITPL